MTISEETIKLIKSKCVTEEVVSDFVILSKNGVNLIGLCPFHKEKTPSFYVSPQKGIYKCFGCGKSGDSIQFLMESQAMKYPEALQYLAKKYNIEIEEESKVYVIPEWRNKTELSENVVKWFDKRGISQKTLIKQRITEGLHYMPKIEKEVNTIQFNYFRDDVLTSIKYRDKDKNFSIHKNTELILYNIDSMKGKKEVIILEGEIDCLSLIEAGYDKDYGVVSVPNGAGVKHNNLKYIDNSIHLFENIEKIYIGTDNDIAGRKLREELAERFGKDRCCYIEWKDKKDANDVLKAYGIQGIIDCCSNPINFPLEGVFTVSDFSYEIDDMYINGLDRGVSIKLKDFALRFVPGYITTITGIPGMGKSSVVDEICLRLLVHHQWKGAFYSPENKPTQLHFSKLARKLVGKHWDGENKMSLEEKKQAKDFLDKKIFFIKPEKDFSLQSILNSIRNLQIKSGIKYFVIDAWNKLEHKGGNDIGYIGKSLDYLSNFCEANSLHCFLVAHPTKMEKDKKTGKYMVPTLYNISGSADFYNKTDNGLCVYVDWETKKVQIHRQKVKFDHWGWLGMSEYLFDEASLRYYPEGFPETTNWITRKPIEKFNKDLFEKPTEVITNNDPPF